MRLKPVFLLMVFFVLASAQGFAAVPENPPAPQEQGGDASPPSQDDTAIKTHDALPPPPGVYDPATPLGPDRTQGQLQPDPGLAVGSMMSHGGGGGGHK